MGMLTGFFDESGTHAGCENAGREPRLSGYRFRVASLRARMVRLQSRIRHRDASHDQLRIKKTALYEVAEEKYNRCIAHALDIIDRHSLMRASCAMKVSDYTSIIKGEDFSNPNLVRAYSLGATVLHEHRRNGDAAMRIY